MRDETMEFGMAGPDLGFEQLRTLLENLLGNLASCEAKNVDLAAYAVGWNFTDARPPVLNDSFGVENPVEVQRYVDNTVGYPAVGPEMGTRRILLSMYQIVEF